MGLPGPWASCVYPGWPPKAYQGQRPHETTTWPTRALPTPEYPWDYQVVPWGLTGLEAPCNNQGPPEPYQDQGLPGSLPGQEAPWVYHGQPGILSRPGGPRDYQGAPGAYQGPRAPYDFKGPQGALLGPEVPCDYHGALGAPSDPGDPWDYQGQELHETTRDLLGPRAPWDYQSAPGTPRSLQGPRTPCDYQGAPMGPTRARSPWEYQGPPRRLPCDLRNLPGPRVPCDFLAQGPHGNKMYPLGLPGPEAIWDYQEADAMMSTLPSPFLGTFPLIHFVSLNPPFFINCLSR
ncbi:collagen alpha-2(IX) chain-like [Homarus americanus]|uniref:collagen alpha-2(IX) chain-like n=1 Tax=Homarus americanus TaxID=6706 RepID=UPI001C486C69|nr:collagen alpha-2(IX) chain-like [Homarus americanus]